MKNDMLLFSNTPWIIVPKLMGFPLYSTAEPWGKQQKTHRPPWLPPPGWATTSPVFFVGFAEEKSWSGQHFVGTRSRSKSWKVNGHCYQGGDIGLGLLWCCWWFRNPAPLDMVNISLFIGFPTCRMVQDFFQPYFFWCATMRLLVMGGTSSKRGVSVCIHDASMLKLWGA